MTIKQLRETLALLGPGHDNTPVVVWLHGTTIDIEPSMFQRNGAWAIEGNIRPGSALDTEAGQ